MEETNKTSFIDLATKCINQTNQSLFLTGKAGTGKTTFLRNIVQYTHKKTLVVAPTGVAAINAGGVTIHFLFQLPFGLFLPTNTSKEVINEQTKVNNKSSIIKNILMQERKRKLLREFELLIIDEVSMLRADVLDAMDTVLRFVRRKNIPFGGVQVLFIGDLLQLPPVVKENEWDLLKNYYKSIYFFDAQVLQEQKPIYIELDKIYRQSDERFIRLLNNLRENSITENDIDLLNKYYYPNFERVSSDNIITLTTHNYKAEAMNRSEIQKLETASFYYNANVDGDFNEYSFPLEKTLELKVGAQIMFVKNDSNDAKRFYNGKIGIIHSLSNQTIRVKFADSKEIIDVDKYVWKNIRYTLNNSTNEIEEQTLGTFEHYPIKLAWAITVHKSQGLTFEKAILDIGDAFATGQIYVALSRLKGLDGLIMKSKIDLAKLNTDKLVSEYAKTQYVPKDTIANTIETAKNTYLKSYLLESFDFGKLNNEFKDHIESYTKDEKKSEKQKHKQWMIDLSTHFVSIKTNADKFSIQLKELLNPERQLDLKFIEERIIKAVNYFTPLLKFLSTEITTHLSELPSQKKLKTYITELQNLDASIFQQLQRIIKSTAFIKAVITNTEFTNDCPELKDLIKDKAKESVQSESSSIEKSSKTKTIKEKNSTAKEPTVNTKLLSFDAFKEGKSIEFIAKERGMAISTIEGHLAHYIITGELEIDKFMPLEKAKHIIEIAEKIIPPSFGAIKAKLGDKYSYGEIKLAMSYQSYLTEKNK